VSEKAHNPVSDPSIRRLFEGKNLVFIASLMKDGSPQVTPTWVDIEDGTILVNTAVGRTKQKNISRDQRVALALVDQNNQYDMVTARGKVVEQIKGKEAEDHADKLAKKYLGIDKYPRRTPDEVRILLKIRPEKIFHMH
jgi:PPOX class probable F420-dependent enzyme